MSCLDMQEAPGRQAVGSVQAGRPEAGQAVCVQQPGESPLQRLETLSVGQQEEQKAIMEVSLQKTGKTLPFFLSYEEEKQGVTKLSLIHISEPTRRTPISYAVFCLKKKKKKRETQ